MMLCCRMVGLLLLTACMPVHAGGAAELSAGAARVDLTPPSDLRASLGGYGERMSRPAEGVHDRVFAKALVISDQKKRFALVTADVLAFPPAVKQAVVERLASDGWTAEQILLLPSHSHTSIDMMQINPANRLPLPQLGIYLAPLYDWTVERLVGVIREAEEDPKPVAVGTAQTQLEGLNANRRREGGPVDDVLTVTRVDLVSGRPLAVLVQWTAHPTILAAEDMLFSAGWPGHLQRSLEAMLGEDVTVMYYNGAQGDQRPVTRAEWGSSRWERAERYGLTIAAAARRLHESAGTTRDVAFDYSRREIDLPAAEAHPQFMQTGGAEYGLTDVLMQVVLKTLVPTKTESVSLRLGDLVLVGVPGEMSAELGHQVKRQASQSTGAPHVVIGGLANQWVSYILSREAYLRGGYEASVSFYGPSLGESIVDGVLAGAAQLTAPRPAASAGGDTNE